MVKPKPVSCEVWIRGGDLRRGGRCVLGSIKGQVRGQVREWGLTVRFRVVSGSDPYPRRWRGA